MIILRIVVIHIVERIFFSRDLHILIRISVLYINFFVDIIKSRLYLSESIQQNFTKHKL